ncbi:uncharacterized protein LOC116267249 [Nymphaea colorata]|nr:uncharacterized protein LOC116267249 [Nymphaea colorata]XP_049937116.1 uncharacterized protein LOC116267249 [Nymphaea colorata]
MNKLPNSRQHTLSLSSRLNLSAAGSSPASPLFFFNCHATRLPPSYRSSSSPDQRNEGGPALIAGNTNTFTIVGIQMPGSSISQNLEEVGFLLEEYASLQEFFMHSLKVGSRPINPDPNCLITG